MIENQPHTIYKNSIGKVVPSCTNIVKLLNKDLMKWANYLGFKRIDYDKYMNELAEYGTYTHLIFEQIMSGKNPPEFPDRDYYDDLEYKELLRKIYLIKDKFSEDNGWKVVYTEHEMYGDKFGGTLDLLMFHEKYGYALLDLKTSKQTYRSHYIQLAGYCRLLKEVENIDVSYVGIILIRNSDIESMIHLSSAQDNERNLQLFNHLLDIYYIMEDENTNGGTE